MCIRDSTITENKHRPHAPPLRFKERTPLMLAALFLSLGLLCGALWLWLQDKIAWWPRNSGPMTQLARQLRQAGVAQQSSFSAENLRTIHAAVSYTHLDVYKRQMLQIAIQIHR